MSVTAELPRRFAPVVEKASRHDPVVSGPLPWAPPDLGRLTLFLGLGGVTLLVAWVGASGTDNYAAQLRWIALGIAALVLSGGGGALWILAGFRNTRARQRAIADTVGEVLQQPSVTGTVTVAEPLSDPLVTVESGTRYHRLSCALVAGKAPSSGSRATHEAAGLRACGVCRP
jgi:hypothetical protein